MAKRGKGSTPRDVMFRAGIQAHPDTKKALKDLGDSVINTQKQIERSMGATAREAKGIAAEMEKSVRAVMTQTERNVKQTTKQITDGIRQEMANLRRTASEGGGRGRTGGSTGNGRPITDREQARIAREEERDADRLHQRHRERQRSTAAENRKLREETAKLSARAALEEEREQQRQHDRHRDRQQSIAKQNRRLREQEEKETLSALKQNEREYNRSVAVVEAANRGITEGMFVTAEGVTRAVQGFLQLGLVGEENTQKLLDGFIKIRSGVDIFLGGLKAVQGAGKVMDMFRRATDAARVAQELSQAASRASTVALEREAVAASTAAAAHGRLGAARRTGGRSVPPVGGRGSRRGGLAVGAAAGSLLAAELGGRLGGNTGSMVAGIGADLALNRLMAGGGAAAGGVPVAGGAAVTAGAWVGAIGGLIAAMASLTETVRNARAYGFGGGARPGSFYDKVATSQAQLAVGFEQYAGRGSFKSALSTGLAASSPVGGSLLRYLPGMDQALSAAASPITGAADSAALLERMKKRQAEEIEVRARRERMDAVRGEFYLGRAQLRDQRVDALRQSQVEGAPAESRGTRQLQGVRNEIATLQRDLEALPADSPLAKLLSGRVTSLQRAERGLSNQTVSAPLVARRDVNRQATAAEQQELRETLRLQEQLAKSGTEEARAKAAERIVQLQERIVGLVNDQRSIEREIADEKARGTRESINALQHEIAGQRQVAAMARDRLASARQQFADLDPLEQQKAIAARRRLTASEQSVATTGSSTTQLTELQGANSQVATLESQHRLAQRRSGALGRSRELTAEISAARGDTSAQGRQRLAALLQERQQNRGDLESLGQGTAGFKGRQTAARQEALQLSMRLDAARQRQGTLQEAAGSRRNQSATDQAFMAEYSRRKAAGATTPEDDAFAASIDDRRRTTAAGGISNTDRRVLGSLGTADEANAAARAGQAEAERRGFSRFFGSGERREIADAGQREVKLRGELVDAQKLEVTIKSNEQAMTTQLINAARSYVDQRNANLETKLREEMTTKLAGVAQASTVSNTTAANLRKA